MTRVRNYDARDYRPDGVEEGAVVTVFRVPPEVAGQRLDVFMRGQLHRTSRTRTQHIVRVSAFDEAGKRLKPNDRVRAEQQIFLWRAPWDETPVPTELPVLYEDEYLLAIGKPPNLPVHPSARYHKNTLIKLLQAERPGEFLSLGHRLDRETSGVILISRTRECDRSLKKALENRVDIEKTYLAITWGAPRPPRRAGDRESATSTSFRCEQGLELDPTSPYRVKMRISDAPSALYASTRFDVEDTILAADGSTAYALVRCGLETGRQHQIRIHLATLGAPIVGDKLYGPDESIFARGADGELTSADVAALELPRHALHAARITLAHPITGDALTIEAPMPDDLLSFWNARAEDAARR